MEQERVGEESYPCTTDSVTTDSGKLISPSLVCNNDRYRWKTENVATLLPFVSLIHPSLNSKQEGKGEKRCTYKVCLSCFSRSPLSLPLTSPGGKQQRERSGSQLAQK